MDPKIFISYSRREVGFVDDLTYKLEEAGFKVWLDYHSLVPGTPWADQIQKGIDESNVALLVISKDAIVSKYVAEEWHRVLNDKERVVMVIFEAVSLPPELKKYEWVDFRGNYKKSLKVLVELLRNPTSNQPPVPENGFKAPSVVWWAFFLSLVTAILSLYNLWSLFVPFFLLPLPYRILKRDFNITQAQAALWLLPVVMTLTAAATNNFSDAASLLWLFSFVLAPVLVFILRSDGMRRWGKPQASLTKFADLYKPDVSQPAPVSFFIDSAPQDARIAEAMTRTFKNYGHHPMDDIKSAQIVLTLLSEFKNDTQADPEVQMVIPIMIQTCIPAEKLSKVQWIDFRGGVRNLDAMAKLLPEPSKLLTALGVRPTGNQLTLPSIIFSIYYFLILLGIFVVGSTIKAMIEYSAGVIAVLPQILGVVVLLGILLWGMTRAIVKRKGRLASFGIFSLALAGVGVFVLAASFMPVMVLSGDTLNQFLDDPNPAVLYPVVAYAVGIVVLVLFLLIRYRDVRLWFPAKVAKLNAK
jgi:hypothetical protein